MIDLRGKHILITGGDLSLLRGLIRQLQVAGAKVTIAHYRWQDFLEVLSDEFGCETLPMNWDDLELEAETPYLGRLDTLHGAIHCPIWQPVRRFIDTTPFDWDEAMEMNYEATVYLSQAVAKHMIGHEVKGSIVFLTTVSTLMPFVDSSLTSTSLATLRPLAKMAAVDCGQYGIRVNMVAMGWIKTESSEPYLTEDGRKFIKNGIPLGAVGEPEVIGDTCCFLISELSRYITGSVITVDGGYTLTRSEGQSPYPASIPSKQ